MNRRNFIQWMLSSFPFLFLRRRSSQPQPGFQKDHPWHECVDRPELPCPACLRWTGDAYTIHGDKPAKSA